MTHNKNIKYIYYNLIEGDILTCGYTFGYICDKWSKDHPQLSSPKGLAGAISTKYPHAYSYSKNNRMNIKVGDINPHLSPKVGIPTIIEMYAQRYRGNAKWGLGETKAKRLEWFCQCLIKINYYLRERNIRNFALPYMIGCNNKKSNWADYEQIINEFAYYAQTGKDPFQVYIIRPNLKT